MANGENGNDTEVKEFIERVEIEPSTDDELVEDETETQPETSPDDKTKGGAASEEDDEDGKPDTLVRSQPADTKKKPEDAAVVAGADAGDGLADVEGETPKERALRFEVTRLKGLARKSRTDEIVGDIKPAAQSKKELAPESRKVLERYKPEEISNLKEVFSVLAEDMGFVRKDELGASNYSDKATEELNSFLEKHPEYLPENDPENVLWGRLREEYQMFKQPEDPKDFRKIFERIHRDIFGIKPAGDLKKTEAAREKIKVASHAGASSPAPSRSLKPASKAPAGLRTDMLKGFDDDFIRELEEGD